MNRCSFPLVYSMKKTDPPSIKRFPAGKQRLMDELLEKNAEGKISPKEKEVLKRLVAQAERLMIANGKQLAKFARSNAGRVTKGAVPVTVWVTAQATGS
jgi:hypothetical protein